MKPRFLLPALSLCSFATAQTIANGSFEFDNDPLDGNHNSWGNTGPVVISAADSPARYLPGWKITRNDSWQYDPDGPGPDPEETNRVNVFNGNSQLDSGLPYATFRSIPVLNGPHTGFSPFDARDGDLYLGFYNDHTPADLMTFTAAETVLTGLAAGQFYRVDYWYSGMGETNAGEYDIDLRVDVDGSQLALHHVLAFDTAPADTGAAFGIWQTDAGIFNEAVYTDWKQGSVTFQATSASSLLNFIGLLQGGPALLQLDNVSITQIPEPGTLLAAAFGMTGLLLHRRR